MKNTTIALFIFVLSLFGGTIGPAHSAEKLVEVILVGKLDEPRGYCLDIAGGKGKRAPIDKGLQAHTCYHYTGGILEDQGFDAALIENGIFRIPYFNVCMSVPSVAAGAPITLEPCKSVDTQKFSLTYDGRLVPRANPDLCDTDKQAYQSWSLHSL